MKVFYFNSFFIGLFLMCSLTDSYAQFQEWTGAIVIGRQEMMSYKIVYQLKSNNNIEGYSISDLNGPMETKTSIAGRYFPKDKSMEFKEIKLISTKSGISTNEFCMMEVRGKFEKKLGKEIFQGNFNSIPRKEGVFCEQGSLVLAATKTIYEMASKFAKNADTLERNDSLGNWVNSKLKILKDVDKVNDLTSGSKYEMKWVLDSVFVEVWDDKLEDGDKISIFKDGVLWVKELTVTNEMKSLYFILKPNQEVVLTFKALSVGSHPPNTVKIVFNDSRKKELLITQLNLGESASVLLKRK